MGAASPDLREELTTLLNAVAFRIWSDLLARAQQTPNAAGLLDLPRFLRVPAEMDIHRRDLDRANGVPNRGGTGTIIGLRFDPAQSENPGDWLTVCPPASWDMSWEDFIADTCHAIFGFEKPRWHYIPEFGALLDAMVKATQTLPEARSRFLHGGLPPGGRAHGPARNSRHRRASVGQGRVLGGRRTRGRPRHRPGTSIRGAARSSGGRRDQANR